MLLLHTPASMAPMDTGNPAHINFDSHQWIQVNQLASIWISLIFICFSNGAAGSGGAGGWTAPHANVSIISLVNFFDETC